MATSRSFRSNMSVGEIDPKLLARSDTEQYRDALKTGTNIILLPQGGFTRRPGLKYLAPLTEQSRLGKFEFNREQQYLFVWSNLLLEIYENEAKITQVVSPYTTAQTQAMDWAQTKDTLVIHHEDVAEHRVIRGTLSNNPIKPDGSTAVLKVTHPAHGTINGNTVGISGVTGPIGGAIDATEINTSHTVTLIDQDNGPILGVNPFTATINTRQIKLTFLTTHSFVGDDNIEITGAIGSALRNIPAVELNRSHVVDMTPTPTATELWFTVSSTASTTGVFGADLSNDAKWKDPDRYEITVTTNATSAGAGGGSLAKSWVLTSLDPTGDSTVKFENLATFGFEDSLSPGPADEIVTITFTNGGTEWASSDKYRLSFDGRDTSKILFSTNTDINKQIIKDALSSLSNIGVGNVTVDYDTSQTPPEGDYVVTFVNELGGKNLPGLAANAVDSVGGLIAAVETVAGGSRLEPVMSAARGYARSGAFFEQRQFLVGLKSRPETVISSQTDDYFNLDPGDAFDSEGLDSTGQFDPILYVRAGGQLFLFTKNGEIPVGTGTESGITPTNITLNSSSRIGVALVPPIEVAGAVMFIDRTERALRAIQIKKNTFSSQVDSIEATEISTFSQHLFNTPVDMAPLRNLDGDYAYIAMGDGTLAVMIFNTDQNVTGFSKLTTAGTFKYLAEVNDEMYASVKRTINGSTAYSLEKFDDAYFTDSGIQITQAAGSVWSGLGHLEAESVDVRLLATGAADFLSGDRVTVTGGFVTSQAGGVAEPGTQAEIGIPFMPTIEPTPPSLARRARLSMANIDLIDSRAVLVNGIAIPSRHETDYVEPVALMSGIQRVRLRGWSERPTVTITQNEPQPMTVRSIEMRVEVGKNG